MADIRFDKYNPSKWVNSDLVMSNVTKLLLELAHKPDTEYYKGVKDGLLLIPKILSIKNCQDCEHFRCFSNIATDKPELGKCLKFDKYIYSDDWCNNQL